MNKFKIAKIGAVVLTVVLLASASLLPMSGANKMITHDNPTINEANKII